MVTDWGLVLAAQSQRSASATQRGPASKESEIRATSFKTFQCKDTKVRDEKETCAGQGDGSAGAGPGIHVVEEGNQFLKVVL